MNAGRRGTALLLCGCLAAFALVAGLGPQTAAADGPQGLVFEVPFVETTYYEGFEYCQTATDTTGEPGGIFYTISSGNGGEATIDNNTGLVSQVTKAGSFTITATKRGLISSTYCLVINKAQPEVTWPTKITLTYGETLGGAEIADGCGDGTFAFINSSLIPTVAMGEDGTLFTLGFTPALQDLYCSVERGVRVLVGPKTLIAQAVAQTITRGESIPLTVEVSGFIAGEGESALGGYSRPTASCSVSNSAVSAVYTGALTCTGGAPTENYSFEYRAGDLTIEPAEGTDYTLTEPSGGNGWFNTADIEGGNCFRIKPAAESGYTKISLYTDGGDADWREQLEFSEETGEIPVVFYLCDSQGSESMPKTVFYKIDRTSPSILLHYSLDYVKRIVDHLNFGLFYKDQVTVTFSGEDALSGINKFQYKTIGPNGETNGWLDCQGDMIIIPAEFAGRIYGRASDCAGNKSAGDNEDGVGDVENDFPIVISNECPGSPTIDTGDYVAGSFTSEDVVIKLHSSAALAGIDRYEYKVAGAGLWRTVEESTNTQRHEDGTFIMDQLTLREQTEHTYYFRAVSNTGVPGQTESVKVNIVKTSPPDATVMITPAVPNGKDGWYTGVIPTIVISEPVYTVPVSVYYKLWLKEAPEPVEPTDITAGQPLLSGDGIYSLKVITIDAAGNSSVCAYEIKVDVTNPSAPTITYLEDALVEKTIDSINHSFYRGPVNIRVEATDEVSGLERIEYVYSGTTGQYDGSPVSGSGILESGESFCIPPEFNGAVKVTAVNRAGNSSVLDELTDLSRKIVLDTIAPVVSITYDAADQESWAGGVSPVDGREYYTGKILGVVTVTENNFYPVAGDEFKLHVALKKPGGEEVEFIPALAWDHVGNVHTASFELVKDGDYTVTASYNDSAQNGQWLHREDRLTLDNTAPAIAVTKFPRWNGDWKHPLTLKAVISITECSFDPSLIVWETEAKDLLGNTVSFPELPLTREQWRQAGNTYTAEIVYTEDANYQLSLSYQDFAGNESAYRGEVFTLDNSAPRNLAISCSQGRPVDSHCYYQDNITVTVAAEDETSGIKAIRYWYEVEEGASSINTGGDGVITEFIETDTAEARHYSATFEISPQFRGRVRAEAVDFAGNAVALVFPQLLIADNVRPVISMAFDNNSAFSPGFYRADRVATVRIDEANFYDEDVEIAVGRRRKGEKDFTLDRIKPRFVKLGDTYTAQVSFSESADYSLDIRYVDRSGNIAKGFRNCSFTVDKVKPVIQVSYDNNRADSGNYYNAGRTATVTITEHNFDPKNVKIHLTASNDGAPIKTPAAGAWRHNGDEHKTTLHFTADGRYVFGVECTDKAGNTQKYDQEVFYIDKTPPALALSIKTLEHGVIANFEEHLPLRDSEIVPFVACSDVNFAEDRVEISLTGVENQRRQENRLVFTPETARIKNGKTYNFGNFDPAEPLNDDVYTLHVKARDRAGNTTEKTINFSVNRYGSTYDLTQIEPLLQKKYVQNCGPVKVAEINPDALDEASVTVTVFRDNETQELDKGKDFKLEKIHKDGDWYEYIYTIFPEIFAKDGIYRISISSVDAAGNRAENNLETKNSPIQFVVDATAPFIQVIDLESGVTYGEEVKVVHIRPSDNLKLELVKVILDGAEIKAWSGKELDELTSADAELVFEIPKGNHERLVLLTAVDAAGNLSEVSIEDFYVTTNILIRYFNNKPLFYGANTGIVMLLAGSAIFIFAKRRKVQASQ